MTPQNMFDHLLAVANEERPIHMFYIPVKIGDEYGRINPIAIVEALVHDGEITVDTKFEVCVETEEDGIQEYWVKLGDIDPNGKPESF